MVVGQWVDERVRGWVREFVSGWVGGWVGPRVCRWVVGLWLEMFRGRYTSTPPPLLSNPPTPTLGPTDACVQIKAPLVRPNIELCKVIIRSPTLSNIAARIVRWTEEHFPNPDQLVLVVSRARGEARTQPYAPSPYLPSNAHCHYPPHRCPLERQITHTDPTSTAGRSTSPRRRSALGWPGL